MDRRRRPRNRLRWIQTLLVMMLATLFAGPAASQDEPIPPPGDPIPGNKLPRPKLRDLPHDLGSFARQLIFPVDDDQALSDFEFFVDEGHLPPQVFPQLPLRPIFALCAEGLREAGLLSKRLLHCEYLRDRMVWQSSTGPKISYDFWSPAQRNRLDEIFAALVAEAPDLGLLCPDPARNYALRTAPDGGMNTFLTAAEAFDTYAAHVAHALWLEATGAVAWSIFDLPDAELTELLSSDRYHSLILPSTRDDPADPYYPPHIRPGSDFQLPRRAYLTFGQASVCDPRDGYRFIRGLHSTAGDDLLAPSEDQTLANLSVWFAANVGHGGIPADRTRASRIRYNLLRDRLRAQPRGSGALIIAPHGCHSATNLLHDLARSVNIPLLAIGVTEEGGLHAGLVFRWARGDLRFLHHTDDIYANQLNAVAPIRSDGTRPGAAEAARLFFRAQWNSPSVLSSFGLRVTDDYGLVPALVTPSVDYPDNGVYGGAWPGPRLSRALLLEKRHQTGVWRNYLFYYCGNVGLFRVVVNRERGPTSRLTDEFVDRARDIVAAYGCAELERRDRDYYANRGTNTWMD